jgi:hypothetical protein
MPRCGVHRKARQHNCLRLVSTRELESSSLVVAGLSLSIGQRSSVARFSAWHTIGSKHLEQEETTPVHIDLVDLVFLAENPTATHRFSVPSVHSPGVKTERSTASHADDRPKRAWRLELQSCADRVTDGKSEQTTAKSVGRIHSAGPEMLDGRAPTAAFCL